MNKKDKRKDPLLVFLHRLILLAAIALVFMTFVWAAVSVAELIWKEGAAANITFDVIIDAASKWTFKLFMLLSAVVSMLTISCFFLKQIVKKLAEIWSVVKKLFKKGKG